jgi:hypothetical protein
VLPTRLKFEFIRPCHPQPAETVPAGNDWQDEIKFDGFRVQAHIIGKTVKLYSRNGSKFSRRFPRLVSVRGELPTRSAIIDGEIVASDTSGVPDFWPQFLRSAKPTELHVVRAADGARSRRMPGATPIENGGGRLSEARTRWQTLACQHVHEGNQGHKNEWPGQQWRVEHEFPSIKG